jgi:signal peptidase I
LNGVARCQSNAPVKFFNLSARVHRIWKRELRPLLITALVVFAVRSSFADWNDVPTGSMKPTIVEGDRVFVNKLAYDLKVPFTTWHLAEWSHPQRGDVVVFYAPHNGERFVKRVVGLPGDTVELRHEQLIINGSPVDYAPLTPTVSAQLAEGERQASLFATEKLTGRNHAVMVTPHLPAMRDAGPIRVPENQYFMMGDNRDNSFDSRYFGPVDRRRIVGRTSSVLWSMNGWLPRGQRFFRSLDPQTASTPAE